MTGGLRSLFLAFLAALAIVGLIAATAAANCSSITTYPETGSYGGANPAEPDIRRCFAADPINCATGNLTETHIDLAVKGHGPPLQMVRAYNSQLAASQGSPGPLGYGWTGSFSAKLVFSQEKTVATVIHDNGSTINFALSGSQWNAPAWTQSTFAQLGQNYVYTQPDYTKLEFSSGGRLLKVTDRHNLALTLTYNTSGRLESVADPSSRKLTFTYDPSGLVEKVTDPMGRVVKYTYSSGNLVSVILPGIETPRWKFGYNSFHELTSLTNGRNYTTITAYDTAHRATSQTDPLGHKYVFAYKETNELGETTITEPNGATTLKKFNEAGSPTSITRAVGTPLEATSTYTYDSAFKVLSVTDPLKHVTTYTYDARGNKLTEKDPNGNEKIWTYNSANSIISTTDPKGQITTVTRSAAGDPQTIKRTSGIGTQESKYEYNTYGDVMRITDPVGRVTKYIYDLNRGLGLRLGEYRGLAGSEELVHTWSYNLNGEMTQEVDARGFESGNESSQFTTKYTIDGRGLVSEITAPLGAVRKMTYDANSNLASVTDGNGNTMSYLYDAADQRFEVKAANGSVTKMAYDAMGQMSTRTNANGNVTEYKHDLLSQVTEVIDPLGRKTFREFDAAGNLLKTTDPDGRSTVYSYDAGGRGTKVDYSSATTADVGFVYDKNSNVVEMTDGTGATKRVYDALDRPIEVTNGKGEVIKYEYNLAGDVTKLTYPNGKAITRAFDKFGRLEMIIDWFGKETKFSYYRNSQLKATSFPSETGNVDEYAYNARGDVTQISIKRGLEVLASFSYTRDKAGQLEKTIQKGIPGGPEEIVYGYDAGSRLVKGNGTSYAYDPGNNPTKVGSDVYTYDKASQILTASNVSHVYNKMGQRTKSTPTSGPATSYAYDQAGNLISAQRPAEGEISAIDNTFKYDGAGLRTTETNGASTYSMAWDSTAELPLLLRKGNDFYIYGPEGLPIAQIISSSTHYFHHDHQGSTRVLTGSTGMVIGTYEYSPYGDLLSFTGPQSTQMGYAGQYRSHASRLIYLRARTYDPVTAQFLSADPVVQESGEPYSYAADNPVNQDDPSGLTVRGPCLAGSVAVPFMQGGGSVCYVSNGRGEWSWIATVSFDAGQNSEAGGFSFDAQRNLVSRFESWLKVDGMTSFRNMLKSGAFLGGAWMWSNADSVSQLRELSWGAGGGAAFGWLGGSFNTSRSASDPRIWSKMAALGYNFGRSPGGSMGGGGSYTIVLWSSNPEVDSIYRSIFGTEAAPLEPTFYEVPCW